MEVREDGGVRFGVGSLEIGHRLVGEHHAPAEGVVRAVALEDLDARRGQGLAQQNRRVQPGRAATHADDSSHTGWNPRGGSIAGLRAMLYCQLLQVSIISPPGELPAAY